MRSHIRFVLAVAAAVGLAGTLSGGRAHAGKAVPGGGGTIYVATAASLTPPQWAPLAYAGLSTMSSDGGGKAALPSIVAGVPGYLLHAGRRWFLSAGGVATRDDGAVTVPLVATPPVRPSHDVAWGRDDSFVSFGAWDSWAHAAPHRVFRVEVAFDAAGVPSATTAPVEVCAAPGHGADSTSGHDWSPDGDRIAWGTFATNDCRLNVTSFSTATTVVVATNPGAVFRPAWSADGGRLAYYGVSLVNGWIEDMGLDVVDASGANHVTLLTARDAPKSKGFYEFSGAPAWSPDGTQILFGASIRPWGGGGGTIGDSSSTSSAQRGGTAPGQTGSGGPFEVYRIGADGGGMRSLTGDTSETLVPLAWR